MTKVLVTNAENPLLPRKNAASEWWYYSGHLRSGDKRFAFHLAFFRLSTGGIRVARIVPAEWIAQHAWFAHLAVADIDTKVFHSAHRRDETDAGEGGADAENYQVWLGDWSVEETTGGHHLSAAIEKVGLDLVLRPLKPVFRRSVHLAATGPGSPVSHRLSCTRMEAAGTLRLGSREFAVEGQAWFDREFGDFPLGKHVAGWEWFAIQLDDSREMLVYRLHDGDGHARADTESYLYEADGTALEIANIKLEATDWWESGATGVRHPVGWRLTALQPMLELEVRPLLRCAEMDTRGSTNIIYWEGPAGVAGTIAGEPVSGRAFVETVGSCNEVRHAGLFDVGHSRIGLLDTLLSEWRGFHGGCQSICRDVVDAADTEG